ncbi:MAG: type II toxin-antitoxin system RelE/ParE family toxin [Campylobacterota bacterium]|nr:type II toxin-antitoxin system RelE/ParE family toxin [Campylobacterota bacterium]
MKDFKFDFAKFNNSVPMIDFLESLSIKERALIYKNIQKLIEYKNSNFNLSDKFTKPLQDGILELKVDLQDKTSRSLYFYEKNQMIIFTNGFIKKSQKAPAKEIQKAKKIMEAYKDE